MNSAQYLMRAFRYNKYIGSRLDVLSACKLKAECNSSAFSELPHRGENEPHIIEQSVIEQISLENDLAKDYFFYSELKSNLEKMIMELDDERYRFIIRHRYCDGFSWRTITGLTNYSTRYLLKLHRSALEEFDVIFENFMKKDT